MQCHTLQHKAAASSIWNNASIKQISKSRQTVCVRAQSGTSAITEQKFDDWISSQGVEAAKRSVAVGPSGMQTTKPVAKGEVCATIPERLWITPQVVAKSDIGPLVEELEPWLGIALFILRERQNAASEWQPYLSSLPAESESPVAWTESELELLNGTQLLTSVQGYRTYFKQRYDELATSLFNTNPDIFNPAIFTYTNFVWAVCTVRSRVHPPLDGDTIALVPFADTVSHSRSPNVSWSLKPPGLFGGGPSLAIEADIAFPDGVDVCMDYGPNRTEGQLLLDYGVMDSNAPTASPAFALTISLPEDDRFYDDKLDVLESNGFPASVEFALGRDGRPPADMMAVLRLVNLSGADAFLLESIFRNEVWEHLQLAISDGNERAVCQSMIDGCTAALKGYATTIEQDLSELRGLEPGSRAYIAVRTRVGEKEALDAALGVFERRIERLAEMEFYGERRLKRLGLLDKEGKSTWEGMFEDGIA